MSLIPGLSDFVIVNDTNPNNSVWDVQRGLFVANTGAGNYSTWLNSGLGSGDPFYTTSIAIIAATSSDGGTTTTFQVGTTQNLTTGNTFNVQKTGLYDGNQQFTVVDGTHLKISVAFAGNATGLIVGAQIVATAAALVTYISQANSISWATVPLENTLTLGAGTTVLTTAQLAKTLIIKGTGTNDVTIQLPPLPTPGMPPFGGQITFVNELSGNHFLTVNDTFSGTHGVTIAQSGAGSGTATLILIPQSIQNLGINETWAPPLFVPGIAISYFNDVGDGKIPIGQANAHEVQWIAPGGDVTMTDVGVFTVNKLQGQAVTPAGTWTPTDQSGAALTFTSVSTSYTQIGNMVFAYGRLTYPATVDGSTAKISLPVAVPNHLYAQGILAQGYNGSTSTIVLVIPIANQSYFEIANATAGSGALFTNANLSGDQLIFFIAYPAS